MLLLFTYVTICMKLDPGIHIGYASGFAFLKPGVTSTLQLVSISAMAEPIYRKVSSLEEVEEVIGSHGEIAGVVVHLRKRLDNMSEGKEMAARLREMVSTMGWVVPKIKALAKLERILNKVSAADSVLDDLIRRTHPDEIRKHRRQLRLRVGSSVRIPALDSASSPRRDNSRRFSTARRRPSSPPAVPVAAAIKLKRAGKALEKTTCLFNVQELGGELVKLGFKIMRLQEDEEVANARATLIQAKKKLNIIKMSEVRVKDLTIRFT